MRKRGSNGVRPLLGLGAAALAIMPFLALRPLAAADVKSSVACSAVHTPLDQLICTDPVLAGRDAALDRDFQDYQDWAANSAERGARLAEQRRWLAGREPACPAAAAPQPGWENTALRCLLRVYQQRAAQLRYERNLKEWPKVRFRPTIVEGKGNKLCDELERDLVASFLGTAPLVNPLGEREIGFAPVPALGRVPIVLRANIDAYNRGRPFPVLQWITEHGGLRPATVEYRAFASPAELLDAIGRGGAPLARMVHEAAYPVIVTPRGRPAGLAKDATLLVDEMPRFFRFSDGKVYLLAPLRRGGAGRGDLGVYRLNGPARLHRICLFEEHEPRARVTDEVPSFPEVAALQRAAGPLLPTAKLCMAEAGEARALADHAVWRPWVLEQDPLSGTLNADRLALFMRNRALTGPESKRQYVAYVAARTAAIAALAPYYRDRFGRSAAEAARLAARYLDRLVADGFRADPDDESIAVLFAPDYADRHQAQRAALSGEGAALRAALGPEPKAVAKGITGDLDEPLVTDAIEHPETLRALLAMGFDPDETKASGRTALMVAARLDLVDAAAILLTHGAAPDRGASEIVAQADGAGDPLCRVGEPAKSDTPGRTALSYAAELASPQMVRLLLEHGASAAKPDSAGRRPADYVKRRTGDPALSAKIAEMLQ
jgi:uncharacterized protein YecT (DUF1311 family)